TNATGVPAGGTITYQYQTLVTTPPNDVTTPTFQTTATDRNGNVTEYQFNQLGNVLQTKEFTNRHVRPSDPAFFLTQFQYDQDYHLLKEIRPLGNTVQYVYSLDSGTSTGGNTATTFNDATKTWTTNQWAGQVVKITGGTGSGQVRTITSNGVNQLTLATAWDVIPNATPTYEIKNADRFQQGNLLAVIQTPDAQRDGDQTIIKTTYPSEPIYN